MKWLSEKVESVEHANWLYKFFCLITFRRKKKLTYGELFMVYYGLNEKHLGIEKAEKFAMAQIIKAYKWNNKKEPDIEENEQG